MRCNTVSTKTSANPAGNSEGDLQGEAQGRDGTRGSATPPDRSQFIKITANSYEPLPFTRTLCVTVALPSLKLGTLRRKGPASLSKVSIASKCPRWSLNPDSCSRICILNQHPVLLRRTHTVPAQIPAPPLPSCVTLDKLPNFSGPSFLTVK